MLLTQGNHKVGSRVWVWSLPVYVTCPGSSPICRAVCYGDWGGFRWPTTRERHAANLEASLRPDFAARMVEELEASSARYVRVHSVGDFYSVDYIRAWVRIGGSTPGVTFWAYTRSWRLPYLLTELVKLAALPNFFLWFSADCSTGLPPQVPRVRTAWLQAEAEAAPQTGAELVFRTRRDGREPTKRIGLALVCPVENGFANATDVTCQRCRFCFTP
jgi:hypothetical protein